METQAYYQRKSYFISCCAIISYIFGSNSKICYGLMKSVVLLKVLTEV